MNMREISLTIIHDEDDIKNKTARAFSPWDGSDAPPTNESGSPGEVVK
ncbi:MAG: hypothetical protein VX294_04630 [Candidatus Latescibacterota bacterium]|nr:hypothetical protein [Candidatus Latescibacterota bacterium]